MTTPNYTMTNDSIVVILDGTSHTIKRGDSNFKGVRGAVISEDWKALPALLVRAKALEEWTKGAFTVKQGHVYYRGDRLPEQLNTRMVKMAREGADPQFLFDFWERLQRNPSMRSVESLYAFLEHQHIPIVKGGYFLAYKNVRSNYTDHHTGTVDHRPGARPKVPRNKVSDDPRTACHYGLHVGNEAFALRFQQGGRMIICQIDPEHVVCVPYDASFGKMRVCELLVLGNMGDKLPDTVFVSEDAPDLPDSRDLEDREPSEEEEAEEEVAALLAKTLSDLRNQAKKMGIKNVKAIAGGKVALVNRMLLEMKPLVVAEVDYEDLEDITDLEEIKETKPAPKVEIKTLPGSAWAYLNDVTNNDLRLENLGTLRKYASNELKIVGASKIEGGKERLLEVIFAARKE